MDADKFLYLMNKYGNCPDCGSDRLGDAEGEGKLDHVFIRSCKCGFEVEVHEYQNRRTNDEK